MFIDHTIDLWITNHWMYLDYMQLHNLIKFKLFVNHQNCRLTSPALFNRCFRKILSDRKLKSLERWIQIRSEIPKVNRKGKLHEYWTFAADNTERHWRFQQAGDYWWKSKIIGRKNHGGTHISDLMCTYKGRKNYGGFVDEIKNCVRQFKIFYNNNFALSLNSNRIGKLWNRYVKTIRCNPITG